MNNEEENYIYWISSKKNKDNNIKLSSNEKKFQDELKFILSNSNKKVFNSNYKNSLKRNVNKNSKNSLVETISYDGNKDNSIKKNLLNNTNKKNLTRDEIIRNNYSFTDIDKDKNKDTQNSVYKLNNAINNINLKYDYSNRKMNNRENIIKNGKSKDNINNIKLDNNSYLSNLNINKNIPLTSNSLNKDQNSTNNTRKIYLHSYRNKSKFKIIRSNNTYTNNTVNLNIFDSIRNNRKNYYLHWNQIQLHLK